MEKLNVLKPNKYDICFSDDFADLNESVKNIAKNNQKAFIVTDSMVAPLYLETVKESLSGVFAQINFYIISAGEQSKTLGSAQDIIIEMINSGFTRDDLIIALGGGVTGDLAGFCASIYMRGIDFIQIPTTLLAQIDSSIGGKVAVDMQSYKNMIGSFHSPLLVYENSSCLKTLPKEQYLSGMGEVIKSTLLGDSALWRFLYDNIDKLKFPDIDQEVLLHILYNTCSIKKKVVEEDPFDTGRRAVLNFGHTIGHAIEKCSDFLLSHGQCVALGTISALNISKQRNLISEDDYISVIDFMNALGLKTSVPENFNFTADEILSAVKKDKKNSSEGLKFILLDGIGNSIIKTDVSSREIISSLCAINIYN